MSATCLPKLRPLHCLAANRGATVARAADIFVAGKQFAQFRDNHHGDGVTAYASRQGPDEQAMLIEAEPGSTRDRPILGRQLGSINLARQHGLGPCRGRLKRSWELAPAPIAWSAKIMSETPKERRRLRWLPLGEIIAVIAVAISASAVKTWRTSPTRRWWSRNR